MGYWNIFQLMTWLDRCVERIYTEIFLETKNVLNNAEKTGKFLFKWAENAWDENCSHVVNLNSVQGLYDITGNTFIVWDANNKSDIWKVYYFDDKRH